MDLTVSGGSKMAKSGPKVQPDVREVNAGVFIEHGQSTLKRMCCSKCFGKCFHGVIV